MKWTPIDICEIFGEINLACEVLNVNLASGSRDETIKLWNTNDESLIRTLTGHINTVDFFAGLQDRIASH